MPCAYGIHVTASGGNGLASGSVSTHVETLKSTTLSSQLAINGPVITPATSISGPLPLFEQSHSVKDASGKYAGVSVKVVNAPNGLDYSSKVLPREGSVSTSTQVSAEQSLTVPKADSIRCTATSYLGTTTNRPAKVILEETKGSTDFVTLTGYKGKAVTTGTTSLASQTATSGEAASISIYGVAKDPISGEYKINTLITGDSGGKAKFQGLSQTVVAGGSTPKVEEKEHVQNADFTSTASYTPLGGVAQTAVRTSNYGTEYDLTMLSKKYPAPDGSIAWGKLGYYVDDSTPFGSVQDAVDAAVDKDTINVAAGTYAQDIVYIDESLAIKGAGYSKTIVDSSGPGNVFRIGSIDPDIDVSLSGLAITGSSSVGSGGGVFNAGRTTIQDCLISGNHATGLGGGIYNTVAGTLTIKDSIISANDATIEGGGGFYNSGTATIEGSTISGNSAPVGGGVDNNIGATLTIKDSTISGNSAEGGGGIWNSGTLTIEGSTISQNSAEQYGGGIYNAGTPTIQQGSQIYLNIADSDNSGGETGGGIYNEGGTTTVFKDQNGVVTADQAVKDSIVFLNHLVSNVGTLNNIAP